MLLNIDKCLLVHKGCAALIELKSSPLRHSSNLEARVYSKSGVN